MLLILSGLQALTDSWGCPHSLTRLPADSQSSRKDRVPLSPTLRYSLPSLGLAREGRQGFGLLIFNSFSSFSSSMKLLLAVDYGNKPVLFTGISISKFSCLTLFDFKIRRTQHVFPQRNC